jgi:hypothetical protein
MSLAEGNPEEPRDREGQAPTRDLIDFYRRWSEFRPYATLLTERSDLSPVERQTVRWLILLVDRVSEHDVWPSGRP